VKAFVRFWRDYVEMAVIAAAVLYVAFWLGTTMCPDRPHCPTEDSCYPEYEDGRWTIIEGERPEAGVAAPVAGTPNYVG